MNEFEKAYELVSDDIGCSGCNICEERFLIFLPGEVEFLSKKFKVPRNKLASSHKIGKNIIWTREEKDKHCIFYKFGRCIKREARPFDCRVYPANLCLENGKLSVKPDKRCPLVKKNKIKKDFIKRTEKAWQIINPPKWWIEFYTELIQ